MLPFGWRTYKKIFQVYFKAHLDALKKGRIFDLQTQRPSFLPDNLFGVDDGDLGGVVSLEDADQAIGILEHVRPEGDDDELRVAGPLLEVAGHDGDVLEVQRCVDLIHDVEGSRLVVVESENLELQKCNWLSQPGAV